MTRSKLIEILAKADLLPIRSTEEVIVYQQLLNDDNFIEMCIFEDYYEIEYFKKVSTDTYDSRTLASIKFEN